jgi:hypothetical protein
MLAHLPPDQLARFRQWFTAFEAGRPDHDSQDYLFTHDSVKAASR